MQRVFATIARLHPTFGFAETANGGQIFFPGSACREVRFDELRIGDQIVCAVVDGAPYPHPRAVDVRRPVA